MGDLAENPTDVAHATVFPLVCALASAVLCGMVMWPIYRPANHGLDAAHYQIGRDFINNWAGPQIAWRGDLATLFNLDKYVDAISTLFGQRLPFHNWGYPPFTLILYWPLGQLPYFWALAIWTGVFFGIYAFVGTLFVAPGRRWVMAAMLALAPACIINAVGGQNGFVTAALLMGGVLCLQTRPVLAGVLFGLLTLKPQLGLALPLVLLALRAWRTILAACITAALLVGGSVLAFGVEPWSRYLTETSAYQLLLLKTFHGFYTLMMVSDLAEMRTWGLSYQAAWAIQAAVSAPVLVITAWAATRTADPRRRAFVVAAAAPLITPYAFNYDLTALTLCLSGRLLQPDAFAPTATRYITLLAWLAPIWLMMFNALGFGLGPFILIPVFGVAAFEAISETSPRRLDPRKMELQSAMNA